MGAVTLRRDLQPLAGETAEVGPGEFRPASAGRQERAAVLIRGWAPGWPMPAEQRSARAEAAGAVLAEHPDADLWRVRAPGPAERVYVTDRGYALRGDVD